MRVVVFVLITVFFSITTFGQTAPVMKSADFKGTKINYYDIGDPRAKNALVFVHCWTCSVQFWRDNYGAFPNYRVIAMDLPGHGTSDKPNLDYSMEYFAKSVDSVLRKAGVKKAVLAGHSMGTPIIRKYYELYPGKTLGLVIVDGALLPFGPRADVEKFFEPLFKDYKTGAPAFIDGMLPSGDDDLKSFVRASMLAAPDHVGQSAMRSMLDDSYATHGRISVPTLAVMAKTPFWPADLEAKYKGVAPDLDFRMWTGVSHFLQLEKPNEFNAVVNEFIQRKKLL